MSEVPAKVLPPIFFRLPNAVLINFLSEWLEIQDVGRLDVAVTTRALRPKFLQYLQDIRSTTVNGKTINKGRGGLSSCSFLFWLSIRRIYLGEIKVGELDSAIITNLELPYLRKLYVFSSDFERTLNLLVKTSPALRSITICPDVRKAVYIDCNTVTHEVLHQIADHCPLLEELMLDYGFVFDNLLYLLNKTTTLNKLTLMNDSFHRWTHGDWERIYPYGHMIHEMGTYEYGSSNPPPAFADFVGACPCLRSLHYFFVPETVQGEILLRAAQSCPLLESLDFDTWSSAALFEISQKCKKLRDVTINPSNQSLSASDLASLKHIETLETLHCFENDLTSEHLVVIFEFRKITNLLIKCVNDAIFVEGMLVDTPLSRSLEKIHLLFDDDGDGDEVFPLETGILKCISACKKIREITLDQRFCDDAGLKILATHFPLLEKITMGCVNERMVSLTFFLTQCKYLKRVSLTQPASNDKVVQDCFQEHMNDLRSCFPHIYFHSRMVKY